MNSTQKIILTIFVPLIIFISALGISNGINYGNPFEWDETWGIWILALIFIGAFECWLYRDK